MGKEASEVTSVSGGSISISRASTRTSTSRPRSESASRSEQLLQAFNEGVQGRGRQPTVSSLAEAMALSKRARTISITDAPSEVKSQSRPSLSPGRNSFKDLRAARASMSMDQPRPRGSVLDPTTEEGDLESLQSSSAPARASSAGLPRPGLDELRNSRASASMGMFNIQAAPRYPGREERAASAGGQLRQFPSMQRITSVSVPDSNASSNREEGGGGGSAAASEGGGGAEGAGGAAAAGPDGGGIEVTTSNKSFKVVSDRV